MIEMRSERICVGYDMYWLRTPDHEDDTVADAYAVFNAAVAIRDEIPKDEKGRLDPTEWQRLADAGTPVSLVDPSVWPGRTERYQRAQDAVTAAYEDVHVARRSYFRLNMSGMSTVCRIMWAIGMTFDDGPEQRYPRAEDFGLTAEQTSSAKYTDDPDYDEIRMSMTPDQREQAKKYHDAVEAHLTRHDHTDTPGIPDHKFSSNDGWIVLPAECEAAARIWDAWLKENGDDTAREVVAAAFDNDRDDLYDLWLSWVKWVRDAARFGGFTVR